LLPAQTLTFLPTGSAPIPTNSDIYNFTGAGMDMFNVYGGTPPATNGAANDFYTYVTGPGVGGPTPSQGQTFTTPASFIGGNPGLVTAIWVRICGYTNNTAGNGNGTWCHFAGGGSFTFRITDPSQAGTSGFAVDTETYTVTGSEPNSPGSSFLGSLNGTGLWLRFGLAHTVILSPNHQYGEDITSTNGPDFFESWGISNSVVFNGSPGTAYEGTTINGLDNTIGTNLVGTRAFLIEFNNGTFAPPPVLPPVITNQPANLMVPQGANAIFTPGVSGTPPFFYQWYVNTNTLLSGQSNATLTVVGAAANVAGYSVVVTNSSGSATSSVARLSVLLPSLTTNLNFSAGGGSILDMNGVSTPFSVRLAGTGSAIPTDDPDLQVSGGALNFASAYCDFNGQLNMSTADAIGINLSALLGFTGTQDFTVSGSFTNIPATVNYDQSGVFAGMTSTNFVRTGIIYNTDFTALPGSYGVGNLNGGDIGIIGSIGPNPGSGMVATIARVGGVWSCNVNGVSSTPGADLTYLNGSTDMTVGVFTLDTSGTPNISTVNGFSASLFTSGPKLSVKSSGGNLTFNWNVLSQGLQSNTNLANPNGWTLVTGTANTNQLVIPAPTTGAKFYRIAP